MDDLVVVALLVAPARCVLCFGRGLFNNFVNAADIAASPEGALSVTVVVVILFATPPRSSDTVP